MSVVLVMGYRNVIKVLNMALNYKRKACYQNGKRCYADSVVIKIKRDYESAFFTQFQKKQIKNKIENYEKIK